MNRLVKTKGKPKGKRKGRGNQRSDQEGTPRTVGRVADRTNQILCLRSSGAFPVKAERSGFSRVDSLNPSSWSGQCALSPPS